MKKHIFVIMIGLFTFALAFTSCDENSSSNSDNDKKSNNEPKTVWSKTYGHEGDDHTAYNTDGFELTTDGGYIFTAEGFFNDDNRYDFWVVKIDANGDVDWEKGFGGERDDDPDVVRQTADGGFIVAGNTSSFRTGTTGYDAWVIKLTASGGVEWQRIYGGTGYDSFADLRETFSDEGDSTGFILFGHTTSFGTGSNYAWFVKINSTGSIEHQVALGGNDNEFGRSVAVTQDGGYILAADTQSFGAGGRDLWLIKMDSSYNVEWEYTYGGTGGDMPHTVLCADDGGYVLGSYTNSFGAGDEDYWLLKVDADGDLLWNYTYGGTSTDIAKDVQKTSDGGYIMAGSTTLPVGGVDTDSYDGWLIKVDDAGLIQWQKHYNRAAYTFGTDTIGSPDRIFKVLQAADGGYTVAGHTDDIATVTIDLWIFKVDSTGTLGCSIDNNTTATANGSASVTVTDTSTLSVITTTIATVTNTAAGGYNANPVVDIQCEVE